MLDAFTIVFCRVVIILVFTMSFIGKLSDVNAFQAAVTNFRILPPTWSRAAAWVFLIGELAVVVLAAWGGSALLAGFLLAVFLLTTFSIALGIAVIRRLRVPCNCFGREEKPISPYDLVRNAGFIICSLTGLVVLWTGAGPVVAPDLETAVLIALVAAVFVMILTNLSDIIQLYNLPKTLQR